MGNWGTLVSSVTVTTTGLPAYSDTAYSDILASVTVFFGPKKDLLILKIQVTGAFRLQ